MHASSHLRFGIAPRAAACFMAAMASCAPSTPEVPTLQRVDLRPLPTKTGARVRAPYRQLQAPADLTGSWRVDGARATVLSADDASGGRPPRRLRLEPSEGERRLSVRDTFEPARFNQIALRIQCDRDTTVHARFLRAGEPLLTTDSETTVLRSDAEITVPLALPAARADEEPLDELQLVFGAGGGIVLRSVVLLNRPFAMWSAGAGDRAELVKIGGESRRALGLASRTTLEGELYAPRSAMLCFDYATPRPPRNAAVRPRLLVELQGRGSAWQQELGMQASPDKPGLWRAATIPLDRFAGETVRVRFSLLGYGGGQGLCALGPPIVAPTRPDPPTVLLITSDTHRADHLGTARLGVEVRTPSIDRLASEGVLFENCFSTTNVTNPSHIALMTGTHPRDHGILNNYTELSTDAPTLAEAFRDAGWRTWAAVSARHLAPRGSGLGQGFERVVQPLGNEAYARRGLDTILSWLPEAEGQPLFCWLHVFDAHKPYEPPPEYDRMYSPADADPFEPDLPKPERPRGYPRDVLPDLRDLGFPKDQYKAEITYLDGELGRLLDSARMQSAVVAFTADHGESFGEHDVWFSHAELYPASTHVPLILRWPDSPRGERVEATVSHLGLGRTLLDLAGLAESAFPGSNLIERASSGPRFALAGRFKSASVLQDGWQLTLSLKKSLAADRHVVELFDLTTDRLGLRDVSAHEFERAQRMRTLLLRWLQAARELGWASRATVEADALRGLAALGYAVGQEDEERLWIDEDCTCEQCARWQGTE